MEIWKKIAVGVAALGLSGSAEAKPSQNAGNYEKASVDYDSLVKKLVKIKERVDKAPANTNETDKTELFKVIRKLRGGIEEWIKTFEAAKIIKTLRESSDDDEDNVELLKSFGHLPESQAVKLFDDAMAGKSDEEKAVLLGKLLEAENTAPVWVKKVLDSKQYVELKPGLAMNYPKLDKI